MNNEQIMQELQSSFVSDYGVSQQLIDNVARLIQENEKLKAKIDVINWQEKTCYEIIKEKYISKDKIKEKIEKIKKLLDECDDGDIREILHNENRILKELIK